MENKILLILLCLQSSLLFCQVNSRDQSNREIETLILLNELIEKDRYNEKQAREYIYGTRDFVQNEILKNQGILSKDDFNSLINLEKVFWKNVENNLMLTNYNYTRFLDNGHKILLNYKNSVLKKLTEKLPSKVECSTLLSFVKEKCDYLEGLNESQLNSSWLKNVSIHQTKDNYLFVIAKVNSEQTSFISEEYVFCNISVNQWIKFKNGGYGLPDSFGERFWEYIKPSICDCQ